MSNLTRCIGLTFALLVLGQPATVLAQNGEKLRALFERLDANNDKVIETSEIPAEARPAFDKLIKAADTNKDGKIDAEEMRAIAGQAAAVAGAGGEPGARLIAMDANKDGKISRAEFKGPEALFTRLDVNKDGSITKDELPKRAAAAPTQLSSLPAMKRLDTNGDGKLSREEFQGPEALFDRLDTNRDGFLQAAEATRFAEVMKTRLTAMDTNQDGKVSKDEFQGKAEMFDRLDVNKDGFINSADRQEQRDTPAKSATKKSATPAPKQEEKAKATEKSSSSSKSQ